MRGRTAVLVTGLLLVGLLPASARASRVVVFPLDARAVSEDSAQSATDRLITALRTVSGLKVIEPKTVEQKLGLKLTEQARACNFDVFCLVEIGEILEVDRMLVGHLLRVDGPQTQGLELKLIVLDVAKAVIAEVLIWRIPDAAVKDWQDALEPAARRLFSPTDALVELALDPPGARLQFYGEPVEVPGGGQPLRYWSGTYYVHAQAPGYHPLDTKVVIPKDTRTRLPIALEPDPLYVASKSGPDRSGQPFDRTSRREGSGVSARDVSVKPEEVQTPLEAAVSNPVPWVVAGAGVGLVVIGSVVMGSAQSSYDELSGQARFARGMTATVDVAQTSRDDARGSYTMGSVLAFSGVAAIVGAGAWMVLSATLSDDQAPSPQAKERTGGQSLAPAFQVAARGLVRDAFRSKQ